MGSTTPATATKLASLNPFRYRGYVYDEETKLYYLRTRYYNPEWGRFINADALLGKVGGLLSHNMFGYCCNRPTMLSDPDGENPFARILGMAALVVATIIAGAMVNSTSQRNDPNRRRGSMPLAKKSNEQMIKELNVKYGFANKSPGRNYVLRAAHSAPEDMQKWFDEFCRKAQWRANYGLMSNEKNSGVYSAVVVDMSNALSVNTAIVSVARESGSMQSVETWGDFFGAFGALSAGPKWALEIAGNISTSFDIANRNVSMEHMSIIAYSWDHYNIVGYTVIE